MNLATVVLSALLLCGQQISAHPINLKREAEAEAEPTNYDYSNVNWNTVNYGAWGGAATTAAAQVPASTQAAPPASTQAFAQAQNVQKAVQAKTSAAAKSTGSSSPSSGSSGSSSSTLSFGSNQAIAFSQYTSSNQCKSESQMAASIKALSSYSVLRLYDVDCNLVSLALKYKLSNQKLLIGIYNPEKVSDSVSKIKKAFSDSGKQMSDHVFGVTVGNEHVNDGKFTAAQMKSYVQQAKSALGSGVKVSVVDVYSVIMANKDLCSGDFVAANAHPYFDKSTTYDKCGSWLEAQVQKLQSSCNTKNVVITETGWPVKDDSSSTASSSNQKSCLNSIKSSSVKNQVMLFSAWNEKWKQGTLEQNWGIMGDDKNA